MIKTFVRLEEKEEDACVAINDVLKTLEYFGIYQRFECIKCHQYLSTISLALAHLRGESGSGRHAQLAAQASRGSAHKPVECKYGGVVERSLSSDGAQKAQRIGEKEVRERSLLRKLPGAPRKSNKKKFISPKKQLDVAQQAAQTEKKEVPPSHSNRKKSPGRERRKRRTRYSLKHIEMILNKKKKDNVFAKQFNISTRDVANLRYNWNKSGKYNNLLVTEVHVVKNPGKHYKQQKVPKGSQEYKIESAGERQNV